MHAQLAGAVGGMALSPASSVGGPGGLHSYGSEPHGKREREYGMSVSASVAHAVNIYGYTYLSCGRVGDQVRASF